MTLVQPRLSVCCFVFLISFAWTITVVAQTTEPKPPAGENKSVATAEEHKPAVVATASESVSAETAKPATSETKLATTEPPAQPQPQSTSDEGWHFAVSPYLWIAGINGQAGVGDLTVDVSSGITDSNVHLNAGFMSTFEARKDKFVILTDLQYSNLGTDRPTPGPLFSSATAEFKTFILDPEVGYRILQNPDKGNYVDVLGGIRYYHLQTDLTFGAGILAARSASRSKGWVDVVGGARTRLYMSKRWFFVGKADLGGGGSKFTGQLLGAVGFQISNHVALLGGYRYLKINYDKDNFLFDMGLSGPILGAGFRF